MANDWRPEELWEERMERNVRAVSPNFLDGRSPNPTLIPGGGGGLGDQINRKPSSSSGGIRHMQECLNRDEEDVLVDPDAEGRYAMTFVPLPFWPHCWIGNGTMQRLGKDFTVSGKLLVPTAEMNLEPITEELWVGYDYLFGEVPDGDYEYDGAIILGTPWGVVDGSHVAWYRMGGVPVGATVHTVFSESFDGPGTWQEAPGGVAILANSVGAPYGNAAYASDIYLDALTRPYYEPGEAPFTFIDVYVNGIQARNSPAPVNVQPGPPPTNYGH